MKPKEDKKSDKQDLNEAENIKCVVYSARYLS